jgi:hypothetical protein
MKKIKRMVVHNFERGVLMKISIKDLTRKVQDKPEVPRFHFPSWDYLYMRDIERLEKWIADFLQAFEEFNTELWEKLREVQNNPARFNEAEILREILGEKSRLLKKNNYGDNPPRHFL